MADAWPSLEGISPQRYASPSMRRLSQTWHHERTPLLTPGDVKKYSAISPPKPLRLGTPTARRPSVSSLGSPKQRVSSRSPPPTSPTSPSKMRSPLRICCCSSFAARTSSASWDAPSPVIWSRQPSPGTPPVFTPKVAWAKWPGAWRSQQLWKDNQETISSTQAPKTAWEQCRQWMAPSFGYLCIIGTITCWVVQNEVLQCLQTAKCLTEGTGFNKPYTMTWWNHSCLVLLLPLSTLIRWKQKPQDVGKCSKVVACCPAELQQVGLTSWKLLWLGLPLATMYLVADYFWYLALPRTTVFVATAIMDSNCAFVFVLSVALFHERVSYLKVQALLIAMCGVLVIAFMAPKVDVWSLHSHKHVHETLFGDVHAAVAALFYALYEVCFAKYICMGLRLSSLNAICAVSGYIGLSTLLLLWPGIVMVHWIPKEYTLYHEQLRWPSWEEVLAMVIGGTMTLIFNAMILLSVAFTSPLKTNVGCMLMIPICGFVDWMFRGVELATADMFGGALIVGGFILLMLQD